MQFRIQQTIAILIAMFLVACAKNEPELIEGEGAAARSEGGPNGGAQPYYLEVVGGTPQTAEAATSLPIEVMLRDSAMRTPVSSETVSFALAQGPDMQTSLSAANGVTNDTGSATVDLRLGMLAGQAVIRATHPKARELSIVVNVSEATSGSIRADLRMPANAPVDLAPYRVSFYKTGDLNCGTYVPRGRTPDEVTAVHVPDLSQPVTQNGIPKSTPFTVVGEALGSGGFVLAGGCVDGIIVNPGETKVADIQLEMVPVSPSGTHTVESVWDISEAVASQNGTSGALVNIVEFMADPGNAIYDIVVEEIEDAAGFGLDLVLDIAGIKDRVIDYINNQIARVGGAETFMAVSSDLSTMLNELQVTSKLTISKTDQEFRFNGHEEWVAVGVSWTWQCEQSNSNDCDTHVVDLTEEGGEAGAVAYDWTGQVGDYDQLTIESHQAQIDIGRLQIYLLEQVILPGLTNGNATSMGEALAHWIDCDQLAREALDGTEICDPTGFLCLGDDEAAAACEFGLEKVGDWAMEPVKNQSSALDINLSGNATLVDADANGTVDQMEDGVLTGELSGSEDPVLVEWTATLDRE